MDLFRDVKYPQFTDIGHRGAVMRISEVTQGHRVAHLRSHVSRMSQRDSNKILTRCSRVVAAMGPAAVVANVKHVLSCTLLALTSSTNARSSSIVLYLSNSLSLPYCRVLVSERSI